MSARLRHSSRQRRLDRLWQKVVDFFAAAAEISNAGILLEALGRWFPRFAAFVAATPLNYFILIGDPLIYFFRSLIRLTKVIGRYFFEIQFEEEKNGRFLHEWQSLGDLLSLACFSLAITLFCGALIAPPVGITVAWTMGLMGLGLIGFFDYYWPETQAYQQYQRMLLRKSIPDTVKVGFYQEYNELKKSRQLYQSLLIGLALLLICGSAVAFAPPLLVPILDVVAHTASLFLGGLACARFVNWCLTRKKRAQRSHEVNLLADEPEGTEMTAFPDDTPQLVSVASRTPMRTPSPFPTASRPSQEGFFSRFYPDPPVLGSKEQAESTPVARMS